MKLFDRSVDLAQFSHDTPLYPVCRAWIRNLSQLPATTEQPPSNEPPDESQVNLQFMIYAAYKIKYHHSMHFITSDDLWILISGLWSGYALQICRVMTVCLEMLVMINQICRNSNCNFRRIIVQLSFLFPPESEFTYYNALGRWWSMGKQNSTSVIHSGSAEHCYVWYILHFVTLFLVLFKW